MEMEKALEAVEKIDSRIAEIQKAADDNAKAVADLTVKNELLEKQIFELNQKDATKMDESVKVASIGEYVTKSDAYKALAAKSTRSATIITKANEITIGNKAPYYRAPGVAEANDVPLTLEAIIPHIPVSAGNVEFLKETAFTNNAAPVAENAAKPQSVDAFELVQLPIQVVAHFAKVTRQLVDDAPALAAFINERMAYGVNAKVEAQLVAGTGTAPQLSGLMASGNYTAQSFTLAQLGGSGATLLDLIRASIAQVGAAGYQANAIVLNPADWGLIQGLKETGGAYLLGSPNASLADVRVWGCRVIPTASMAQGKYLVGDFARAATIYDRLETVVDIAAENENDFIYNRYTIRAERRLALAVERPAALVGGNLVVPNA